MERFTKLFGSLIVFVYHCFDRVVIHGYLSGLSRPEQVVYFFRQVLGISVVSKEILRQRTDDSRYAEPVRVGEFVLRRAGRGRKGRDRGDPEKKQVDLFYRR